MDEIADIPVKRILIAEDDPRVVGTLAMSLQAAGYEYDVAEDGVKALEMLQSHQYAVGIYDIIMPRMDGIELLAYTSEIDPTIPVIMITGVADVNKVIETLNQGAYSFLRKPFDIDEILNAIRNAIRHRELIIDNENYKKNLEKLVERRTAELQLEKEKLENALSSINTGLLVINPIGEIIWRNRIFSEWFINVANWGDFFVGKSGDSGRYEDYLEKIFQSEEAFQRQFTMRRRNAEMCEFQMTTSPIKDQSGKIVQAVSLIRDVTEQNRLERELLHSERLASMGEIAAGLAHEINNPMMVILGLVQNILNGMDKSHPEYEDLRIIETETKRTSRVIRSLMEFTYEPAPQKKKIDLVEVCAESVEFMDYMFKEKNVQIKIELPQDRFICKGDPDQLKQVFLNLMLNSHQAMPEGGSLTVKFNKELLDGSTYMNITLADTGIGINPDDLQNIFNPFFTKKGNKGTGLGLSIVKRIIEGHGGEVNISSKFGEGTICKIKLPT